MFCVIYKFAVQSGREEQFIRSWSKVTVAFKTSCGALGSRLHKSEQGEFIAYAQWPSKAIRDKAELPIDVKEGALAEMRSCCDSIETLHELTTIVDLLEK